MSQIVFAPRPISMEVQALQVGDIPTERKFARIEDRLRIAREVNGEIFEMAQWEDKPPPRPFNATVSISGGEATIPHDLFQSVVAHCDQNELRKLRVMLPTNPLPNPTPIQISDGWSRWFYDLRNALLYVIEKNGRAIAVKVMEEGVTIETPPHLIIVNKEGRFAATFL